MQQNKNVPVAEVVNKTPANKPTTTSSKSHPTQSLIQDVTTYTTTSLPTTESTSTSATQSMPTTALTSSTTQKLSSKSDDVPNITFKPIATVLSSTASLVTSYSQALLSAPSISRENPTPSSNAQQNSRNGPILNTVQPTRSVFLSRLDPNTNAEDIFNYVKFYAKTSVDFKVRKMLFRNDVPYSSFVINVGRNEGLFNTLVDANFWPVNTIAREYDFSQSKNNQNNRNLNQNTIIQNQQ